MNENYEKLAKKFLKDFKHPIALYRKEEFDYYLELFDNVLGCKKDFISYCKMVDEVGFDNLFILREKLRNDILEHVKNKESYKEFISMDFKKYSERFEGFKHGTNFLSNNNVNKKWISIDMSKANFYSFKTFNEDLVDGYNTFEEWVMSFENGQLFKDTKILRQILFGEMNPKRNQSIQKFYMSKMIEFLGTKTDINKLNIIVLGADEVLVEYEEELLEIINDCITNFNDFCPESKFKFKVEVFELLKISDIKEYGYVKKFENEEVKFTGVSKNYFAQSFKYYYGLPIEDRDLKFYMDGIVATYERPLISI